MIRINYFVLSHGDVYRKCYKVYQSRSKETNSLCLCSIRFGRRLKLSIDQYTELFSFFSFQINSWLVLHIDHINQL